MNSSGRIGLSVCAATLATLLARAAAAQNELPASPAPAAPAEGAKGDETLGSCADSWWVVQPCRARGWTTPRVELGVALGVSAMNEDGPLGFGDGVGSVMNPGPAWSLLVGLEILPWVAVEARYLGMYDSTRASVSPSGGNGFLATAGTAVVRLTLPLPFVHPYVVGGIGYYDFAFVGPSGSPLHSSSQAGIPLGIGIDVPLNFHLSVGAEATYNFQIDEDYSETTKNGIDGGDNTRFDVVVRARL